MKKGTPAVQALGRPSKILELAPDEDRQSEEKQVESTESMGIPEEETGEEIDQEKVTSDGTKKRLVPPTQDEYIWMWKVNTSSLPSNLSELRIYFMVLA